jgi:crotonobetainyl-CoA:carnitine CoA-transferase CaiB-like acyl-CoA transferase
MQHAGLGRIKTVANPTKFSATPLQYSKAPPTLGEDTAPVLRELLGLTDEEIASLGDRGVV